jgi:hypothetical protein
VAEPGATRVAVTVAGRPLSGADLDAVVQLQVEEAAEEPDAAVITTRLEPGSDGAWAGALDRARRTRAPLVVELQHPSGSYRLSGRVAQAAWTLDVDAGSTLTVKALDRVLDLDAEERVRAWPGMSDSDIAEAIYGEHGLRADVERTPPAADADTHVALQRSTDWRFLQSLARKWGWSAYVESSAAADVGHFRRVAASAPTATLVVGRATGVARVEATADLLAAQRVRLSRLPVLATAASGGDSGRPAARTALLTGGEVDGEVDPEAVARGWAARSDAGLRVTADVETALAGVLLRARRTVRLQGAGDALTGDYLVERVRHVVDPGGHRQRVVLRRPAGDGS